MAKPSKKAVAVTGGNKPPAALATKMKKAAGRGLSSAAEDNLVPLVVILQAQSPQVLKRNPAYMEGAEAGMIWLKNAPNPLVSGEEGFIFQPCYYDPLHWVEWIPREKGGGFAGRHTELPSDAVQVADPKNKDKMHWERKNGNTLVQTRGYSGIVHLGDARLPYAIPLASTNHNFGKALMTQLNGQQIDGERAPIYGSLVRVTTKFRQNQAGEWFAFELAPNSITWVTDEADYDAGEALHNAFASGEKAAAMADDDAPAGGNKAKGAM